ncbi:SDR family oxidoreductase [Rhodococcus fascians]|nr:SDR family oxidoreductase [Rhodococcus fascians]MBY4237838.1 SDR family oxidoreductase [Rhodococcus fascians]MBY4253411.1 SDR family oxidoreductase [Rhodococcus fascians]MBY4269048.1 SDR family oxidoreductase [Rhodococcus fascians]MBY4275101.1 SDR family oxidoreductase [Rhodococcus fascians]
MDDGHGRLQGRVVLLTGANGGLGATVAQRLAREGAHVVVTDLREDACRDQAASLERPHDHMGAGLDVTAEQDWNAVCEQVLGRFGKIDALLNNAALGSVGAVDAETVHKWNRVIDVGQTGTFLGMKCVGPVMERNGGGSIVNVCSILGTVGGFGNSIAYAAAKGAVRTMTKNAALHWAGAAVRVNSLHPGFIGTEALHEHWEGTEQYKAMLDKTPMGRLGTAEEVAGAIVFLIGDDSTFVTGSELYVDGGWTAA